MNTNFAPAIRGKLLIVMVSHTRNPDYESVTGMNMITPALWQIGWQAAQGIHVGDADLAGARNLVLANFLASDFTDLLFLDSDVSWDAGAIERLVSHPVDLVGGAYPKRVDGGGYPVRTLPGIRDCVDPITRKPHPNGLLPVGGLPTGLMRITKSCAQTMVDAYPDKWYRDHRAPDHKCWNLFEFAVKDNDRWTEDMWFCQLWRDIGGDVWCDPHLTLHHHGTKTYSGRFSDYIADVAASEKIATA